MLRFPSSPVTNRAKQATKKRHSFTHTPTSSTSAATSPTRTGLCSSPLGHDLSHLSHLYDLKKLHEAHKHSTMSSTASSMMRGFKFIDWLGEGTDGLVFCAWDTVNSRKVAIKAISKNNDTTSSPTASDEDIDNNEGAKDDVNNRLKRAMKEVNYLRQLDHPNIIKVHQVVDTEQELFVVMDYADSGDLFEFMYKLNESDASLELKESIAKRIFVQTLLAVEHCHKHHIAHRDLKPENILLTSNLNVLLADFGLASRFSKGKMLNSYVGSLVYASPEVLSGLPYSAPEVDIWALGILLCELLCGVYPFGDSAGQSPREDRRICRNILRCKYQLPQDDNVMSPLARDLIARILQPVGTRISLQGIKSHPWLASATLDMIDDDEKENDGIEEDVDVEEEEEKMKENKKNGVVMRSLKGTARRSSSSSNGCLRMRKDEASSGPKGFSSKKALPQRDRPELLQQAVM